MHHGGRQRGGSRDGADAGGAPRRADAIDVTDIAEEEASSSARPPPSAPSPRATDLEIAKRRPRCSRGSPPPSRSSPRVPRLAAFESSPAPPAQLPLSPTAARRRWSSSADSLVAPLGDRRRPSRSASPPSGFGVRTDHDRRAPLISIPQRTRRRCMTLALTLTPSPTPVCASAASAVPPWRRLTACAPCRVVPPPRFARAAGPQAITRRSSDRTTTTTGAPDPTARAAVRARISPRRIWRRPGDRGKCAKSHSPRTPSRRCQPAARHRQTATIRIETGTRLRRRQPMSAPWDGGRRG